MNETTGIKPETKCEPTGGLNGGRRLCSNRKNFKLKEEATWKKLLPVTFTHLLQVRKFLGKKLQYETNSGFLKVLKDLFISRFYLLHIWFSWFNIKLYESKMLTSRRINMAFKNYLEPINWIK